MGLVPHVTGVVTGVALAVSGMSVFAQTRSASEEPAKPSIPSVVEPGRTDAQPPADAIVLFDGTSFDAWRHTDGRDVEWILDETDRSMSIKPRSGSIVTSMPHGACQLHLEFATPKPAQGEGQGRGNSGVYLQSRYEVQVLDSYLNETYPGGQCGAIYGQHPPLVNASRPPGEWQTYDIIFHPPMFDGVDARISNGTMTVFHNGILIQDHVELRGPTTAAMLQHEEGTAPLYLQDHGNAVKYRNIWMRPLK